MNQPLRMSSATSLIVLGSMIAGCATHNTHMAAASHVDGKPVELGFATRALAALNSNNVPVAIDLAEKAVAKSPTDAAVRTLLGNAYFAGGRFISAEGAYRDSLTLDSSQTQVILRLALVEIAQGKDNRAVAMLRDSRGLLDASDYGLAMALAGRTSEAISVLQPAARQSNDPTVRQNLALAQALAGNWEEARIIAAQDVPANQLDARMQQWMQIAKPSYAAEQVAAVVGVTPAAIDPGQPLQIAINKTDTQPQKFAAAPVRVAEAFEAHSGARSPANVAAPSRPAKAAFVAVASPVIDASPLPVAAVAPAPQVVGPTIASLAASAVAVAVADAKAVLASIVPHSAPVPLKRARPHVVAGAASYASASKSHAVVQLGAYGSADRVLAAWTGKSHKYGALRPYAPMSARFSSPKGTFYRLSVQGFNTVAQAKALCVSLRHSGEACFVRNIAGDAPVNIALR